MGIQHRVEGVPQAAIPYPYFIYSKRKLQKSQKAWEGWGGGINLLNRKQNKLSFENVKLRRLTWQD